MEGYEILRYRWREFQGSISKIGQVVTSWRCFVIIFIDHMWRGPHWIRYMQIDKQWWTRRPLRWTKVENVLTNGRRRWRLYNDKGSTRVMRILISRTFWRDSDLATPHAKRKTDLSRTWMYLSYTDANILTGFVYF